MENDYIYFPGSARISEGMDLVRRGSMVSQSAGIRKTETRCINVTQRPKGFHKSC